MTEQAKVKSDPAAKADGHSPEPWHFNGCGIYYAGRLLAATGDDGNPTAMELQHADARRIVACVNACAGISTEELEIRGIA